MDTSRVTFHLSELDTMYVSIYLLMKHSINLASSVDLDILPNKLIYSTNIISSMIVGYFTCYCTGSGSKKLFAFSLGENF